MQPFHLAITVRNLDEARQFYGGLLGCELGRSDDLWQDFSMFGHQLVCHLDVSLGADGQVSRKHNPVDQQAVPVPHFGVVLGMQAWESLAERLRQADTRFLIPPTVRFKGQVGEQATMFFQDPSGNCLEFKAFTDPEQIFSS